MTLKEFFETLRKLFVTVDVDDLDTDEKDKDIEEKEAVKVDDTEDKSDVEDKEDKIEEVKEDKVEEVKDEEVKDEEVKTEDKTDEVKKEDIEVKTEDVNLDSEDKKEDSAILEDGWFDIETGTVDFNKIHNDEVKSKIKAFSDSMKIKAAVNEKLKAENLAVSVSTAKKLMDLSSVTVDEEGKVDGVDEAIKQLKSTEPGLFKKTSSSLNEPFNPLNKSIDMNPKSFADALRLMDEV